MLPISKEYLIYGGHFDTDEIKNKIKELEKVMEEDNFWSDKRKSEAIIAEYNSLKKAIDDSKNLKEEIEFHLDNLKNNLDESITFANEELANIGRTLDELELSILLNGEYDKNDAILEIHSGAGGTEACDWANMLYRMYTRWCEKKGYKIEVISELAGGEVGIKNISLIVKGINAYGYLKSEKGIHRLVRISPFDSNSRRRRLLQ